MFIYCFTFNFNFLTLWLNPNWKNLDLLFLEAKCAQLGKFKLLNYVFRTKWTYIFGNYMYLTESKNLMNWIYQSDKKWASDASK